MELGQGKIARLIRWLGLGQGKAKARRRAPRAEGMKAEGPQYRGPNGETWTGGTRGRKPGWLTEALASGKTLADLAV